LLLHNYHIEMKSSYKRLPEWIRTKVPGGETYVLVKKATEGKNLHTVCLEAKCPNVGECFCGGRAAFLVLGDICTRNCRYCAVSHGKPAVLDPDEPRRIAEAVSELNLSYTVITSVTRDDCEDGGASHIAACVRAIRKAAGKCKIEVLIPDFRYAGHNALDIILKSCPDVVNHNIEVVRSLFPELRPQGEYDYSLSVLHRISSSGFSAKSGLMIGFGESESDIVSTFEDLRRAGCSILTVGQYLRSSKEGFPVSRYYRPEEFLRLEVEAKKMGFEKVLCGPLVRSSYHAERTYKSGIY